MFFILSKILAFIITPIVWVIGLLLCSLFSKNPKRKRISLIATLAILLIFSNAFLFDEVMRRWEIPGKSISELDSSYDAGIVLGGLMTYDVTLDRIKFGKRNDRLMQSFDLYKKGKIKKIFFTSGAGTILDHQIKEATLVKRFATELCIPDSDFIIESESDNTHENAAFSKPLLDKYFPNGKFLLITSGFHMRRSLGCFRKEDIHVTPYSTDRLSGPRKYVFDHLFIPNMDTLHGWDSLLHEWAGFVIYKMMGYV